MRIGIGMPNPVKGTPGRRLVEWAQRAEERGFAGLATVDRLAYPNYDSLTTLAAAAGATSRIGLITNILIAPLYPPPLLAKAAASIDQISGGRFTLGLAPGARPDDYAVAGRDFHTRGRDFDAGLELIHRAWAGEVVEGSDGQPITPPPVHDGRVPILFGGTGEQALSRMAKWGAGYAIGGVGAAQAQAIADKVRATWKGAGRAGEPRISALGYYSLGEDAAQASVEYLRDYYGFLGGYAERIAAGALRSEDAIRAEVDAYEAAGITELYLDPTTASLDQVDRLADVVL
jgi:alkanesulfonate monooxygenase SsuD/methylene tetrahydromethanopterin reductase-like flavin-dependent oxidoreductase (luciferase family)